jgi:hypothetical protein
MAAGDQYRALAVDCDAHASHETDPAIRGEWEGMARAYRHLAEQAERNSHTDVVYEPPPEQTNVPQRQAQQPAQPMLKPEE